MMNDNRNPENETILDCRERLNEILDTLDELHSAASDHELHEMTNLSDTELMSFLQDLIYTAQETIHEIQIRRSQQKPILLLVEKAIEKKIG